jgi:hypothetical protein
MWSATVVLHEEGQRYHATPNRALTAVNSADVTACEALA